ncbi:hypothetical protein EMIT036CA2_20065 [Chryseobacterium sp. IT-36CA2]
MIAFGTKNIFVVHYKTPNFKTKPYEKAKFCFISCYRNGSVCSAFRNEICC